MSYDWIRDCDKVIFWNKDIRNIILVLIIVNKLEMKYVIYINQIPDRGMVIQNENIFI